MLVRIWSKDNSYTLLVEMQKGKTTLEDSLVNPYKTKHTLKHMVQQLYSLMCTQMS